MEGTARAAKKAYDLAIYQAWHGEAFARQKRLDKLDKYTGASKPKRAQSGSEMLAAMRSFQAKGAGMTIRRVN